MVKSRVENEAFEKAWVLAKRLSEDFLSNKAHYLSSDYQESEVRKDFIDKMFVALGWDVDHNIQLDPYRQEVKIEKSSLRSRGKADYAFSLAPFFQRIRFFVEAKRPQLDIATPDNAFQAIRYSWPRRIPIAILTDFHSIHIVDSRFRPNIDSAVSRVVRSWNCAQFADREVFAEIYWLISREAVAAGSIERFAEEHLPTQNVAARQYSLFPNETREFDDDFLAKLDEWREALAIVFKHADGSLTGEQLTEVVQKTLDRLIMIRFLEDKQIEEQAIISRFGQKGRTQWADFIEASARLDQIYNGVVFKVHRILDAKTFRPETATFAQICDELTDEHSPYNFDSIPVEILGRIYERFLGKIVSERRGKVDIIEKEDVRKAGGIYYTPDYIVAYMVEQSLGRLVKGKSAKELLQLRIIDTSCGSGSFLIAAFRFLLEADLVLFRTDPSKYRKADIERRDGEPHLTMSRKREILLNCIYGVDTDPQAVEVAQLSLYLKLLDDETTNSARQQQLEMGAALLPSLANNIIEGNSLVTLDDELFSLERLRETKSLNFRETFREVFDNGGFDLLIGNPPYIKEYTNRAAFDHVRTSPYYLGKMDIWYLFACRGIDWLKKETGIIAFIATNNWVTNAGAKKLREKLNKDATIELLIDFGDFKVFRDAGIQTMILIARKTTVSLVYSFDYRRIKLKKPILADAQALLQHQEGHGLEYLYPAIDRERRAGLLTFSGADTEAILAKLQNARNFYLNGSLEIAQGIVPNIDVVSSRGIKQIPPRRRIMENIQVGDGVFVVPAGKFRSASKEEKEFLKPLFEPTDVQRYAIVKKSQRRIVYSSKSILGGRKLPQIFMDHLKSYREIMEKRRENQTGQLQYFHLHWPRDQKFFDVGPKILCVRKCEEPVFAYSEEEAYVMMAFNVIRSSRIDLLFLSGLLNSRLVRFWLKHRGKMQGNNFQLDKEPLLEIPILAPSPADQTRIARLVRRLIDGMGELSKATTASEHQRVSRMISQWDNQIQSAIEDLYGLTPDERTAIKL
jgi:adenine-specific DNA-methyltransferase